MNVLSRPSLDYQYLFDLCGVEAHRAGLPCLLRTANHFFASELVRRIAPFEWMRDDVMLPDAPTWFVVEREEHETLPTARMVNDPLLAGKRLFKIIIWAEPTRTEAETLIPQLRAGLSADGRLCVLVSRHMANALPEQRGRNLPKSSERAGVNLAALLRKADFRQVEQHSFHGPISLLWWQASRWLDRFHFPALADRCWYAMRAGFRADGWQASFSTVTFVTATP